MNVDHFTGKFNATIWIKYADMQQTKYIVQFMDYNIL